MDEFPQEADTKKHKSPENLSDLWVLIDRKMDEKDSRDNKRFALLAEELMSLDKRVGSLELSDRDRDRKISFPHWIVAICALFATTGGSVALVLWIARMS